MGENAMKRENKKKVLKVMICQQKILKIIRKGNQNYLKKEEKQYYPFHKIQ
jgi:hypothetical protein